MSNLKHSFDFLVDLRFNNDRIWFNNNKDYYLSALKEFENLINDIIPVLKTIDNSIDVISAKECMFRIYKDVRFSANKDPYKINFGAHIVRGGKKSPFAGYYIHFEPDNSFVGGGIYMPQSDVLKKIRTNIMSNSEKFKSIVTDKVFLETFVQMMDDKLKTPPKGFPKDHPDIKLIYYKSYAVGHSIPNEMWFKPGLVEKLTEIFKIQYNFNSFLNKAIE